MMDVTRRKFVSGLATLPLWPRLLRADPRSEARPIERLILVYHPDGAYLDQWHLPDHKGPIKDRPLSTSLSSLAPFRDQLILLRQLNILDGKGDGHPEPASFLWTGGAAQAGSLDVQLADYFGTPLIHLGVQASKYNGESISYLPGGAQKVADDSPQSVYQRYFAKDLAAPLPDQAVLAQVEKELAALQRDLPAAEQLKLSQHLKQLQTVVGNQDQCRITGVDLGHYSDEQKHLDPMVPQIFRWQLQFLFQALACGISPIASLQFSRHTSPMKMDFDWLAKWDGRWPMESHQASHNDAEIHAQQKRWFNHQLSSLLQVLQDTPEPQLEKSGSMLDHSLVVVMTEISQGAAHSRQDMPFYMVGGRGCGLLRHGEVVDCRNASHASLLYSLAELMGMPPKGAYAKAGPLTAIYHS